MNCVEQRGWSEELLNNWPSEVPRPQTPASWLPSARSADERAVHDAYSNYAMHGDVPPLVEEAMRYVLWSGSRYVIPEEPAAEVWECLTGEGPAARAMSMLSLSVLIPFREDLLEPDPHEIDRLVGKDPDSLTDEENDQMVEYLKKLSKTKTPEQRHQEYKEAEARRNNIARRFEQEYLGLPPLEVEDEEKDFFGTGDLRLREDRFYVRQNFEDKYWWQRHGGEVPTEALAQAMGMEADVFLSAITRFAVDANSMIKGPIPAWSTIRADEYLLRVMPAEDDPSQVRVTAPVQELTTTGHYIMGRILRVYEAGMNYAAAESEPSS